MPKRFNNKYKERRSPLFIFSHFTDERTAAAPCGRLMPSRLMSHLVVERRWWSQDTAAAVANEYVRNATRDIKLFHRLVVRVGLVKTGKQKKRPLLDLNSPVFVQPLSSTFCNTRQFFFSASLTFVHIFQNSKMRQPFPVLLLTLCVVVSFTSAGELQSIISINIAHHFHLLNYLRNQTTFSTIAQLVDVLLSGFERSQQNGNDPATIADAVSHRIAGRSCCQHRNREHHFATYFT